MSEDAVREAAQAVLEAYDVTVGDAGHRSVDGYCIEPGCTIHAANPRPDVPAPTVDAAALFTEYRYLVGKVIHDLGGPKGLADALGPLGDRIDAALRASAPGDEGS